MADSCVFCKQSVSDGQKTVTLKQKGVDTIRNANQERGSDITVIKDQVVHEKCRKEFTNPLCIKAYKRKLSQSDEDESERKYPLRSDNTAFDYKNQCIFCGFPEYHKGKKAEFKLIPVRTFDFQGKILRACDEFKGEWADTVRGRVLYVEDLPAAEAQYHKLCSTNFRTGRQIPVPMQDERYPKYKKLSDAGRPKDVTKAEAFLRVTQYLEDNDDEQVTIADLIDKMSEFLGDGDSKPYSFKHMKMEIMKHFGDRVIITEINGKQNVVTFHTTAARILHDFHSKKSQNTKNEKVQIIETAAKLLKQDIKDIEQNREMYSSSADLSPQTALQFLPSSLHRFLDVMIHGQDSTRKISSLGQAIIQAVRPRVILAPLQIGLGVQMHHHFQSKFLIDTLHRMGFSCSYSEVQMYERSSAVGQGTDLQNFGPNSFMQYAADNLDHNVKCIDGKNTFHGMGMIAMITPSMKTAKPVKRVKASSDDIIQMGRINISNFVSNMDKLQSLCYTALNRPEAAETSVGLDILWKSSLLFKIQRPQWSGFMQQVHKGDHPGESSIIFLPIIDMDPSDLTCIYSTLRFVTSHARRHNCTPIVTFDQPLWWKAYNMVGSTSDLQPIVLRLDGFHTKMSFLGAIGHVMCGSGLHELLEVTYA